MNRLHRYLFAYEIPSEGKASEMSVPAKTEDDARAKIKAHIADMEFIEEDQVIVGELIKSIPLKDNYYVCEGCEG